ncbi:MAG: pyridoxal phosphate-dependent aminotransferase [Hyphomicrobiaceae bacterium]
MAGPRYTKIVSELPSTVPFVGPEAQERARGAVFKARIGANESVFGPSPKAVAAVQQAATENWKYCDPDNYDLKHAVAAHHGVNPDNIVIIEGIDGGLGLINRMVVEPGDPVITSDGAYPTFNFHVAACGGRLTKVPFKDDHEDLGRLLDEASRQDAKILYVSNPNNPMGTWWSAEDIAQEIADLPAGTVLVLDEAYCDTAPADALPPLDVSNPMVVRFRTFSKAYGMAGARIGYCLGHPDVIASFDKVRNHYGINRLAQVAALAALGDQAYLTETVAKIAAARDRISTVAKAQGLEPLPSATNFVTIDCRRDGAYAQRVMQELLKRDIFVRMPGVAPLNRCIRISAGRESDLALFEAALPGALQAAAG